jgi:nucleotide-binding universal stress UspA family protein
VLSGEPIATLNQYVKSHETDFLVLGLSSRSALDRAVTGSTAEPLLKKLPCELLVLPATKASN